MTCTVEKALLNNVRICQSAFGTIPVDINTCNKCDPVHNELTVVIKLLQFRTPLGATNYQQLHQWQ